MVHVYGLENVKLIISAVLIKNVSVVDVLIDVQMFCALSEQFANQDSV